MAITIVWKLIPFHILLYLLLISETESATIYLVNGGNVSSESQLRFVNKIDGVIDSQSNKQNGSILTEVKQVLFKSALLKTIEKSEESLPKLSRAKRRIYFIKVLIPRDFAGTFFIYYDRMSTVALGILFGIVLETKNVRAFVERPIGLCVGIFCKFIFLPMVSLVFPKFESKMYENKNNEKKKIMRNDNFLKLSYVLGSKVFEMFVNNAGHQMDFLVTVIGVSGTLANCWTAALKGNVDLSIVMSLINTVLYFGKLFAS